MKRILCLLAVLAAAACAPKDARKAEHVIFIGLDGWGSFSVENADMPNVKALMAEGCYTLQKRAVLPSSSAVNWATMFMGANPEVHGHTQWNSYTPEIPSYQILKNGKFPTVFQLIDERYPEAEIGCIFEWDGIEHVIDSLAFDYHEQTPDCEKYPTALGEMAVKYILEEIGKLGKIGIGVCGICHTVRCALNSHKTLFLGGTGIVISSAHIKGHKSVGITVQKDNGNLAFLHRLHGRCLVNIEITEKSAAEYSKGIKYILWQTHILHCILDYLLRGGISAIGDNPNYV